MGTLFDRLEEGKPAGPEEAELHRLWHDAAMDDVQVPDTGEAWQALSARLDEAEPAERKPLFAFGWPGGLALAAALVLTILAARWFLIPAEHHFKTQPGEYKNTSLADGSTVRLNADTDFSLNEGFDKDHRTCILAGEAFFDVQSGKHPFVIETELARVQVIGTRFNVFAREGRLNVGVVEGVVKVSDGNREVTLEAGQQTWWPPRQAVPEPISQDRFPPWENALIHCDRTPLAEVCAEIGRRFNVRIHIQDPAAGQQVVDGLLDAGDPETALGALCLLVGKEYRREGSVYIIE